ncbi:hypothetical protein [Thorsellia kenyensis]|uniref:Uncharacterized protein n=1 Tax=Thorsellia kenyensis TaxID=1549888 RepID=A0ABV6CDC5_9GAMM
MKLIIIKYFILFFSILFSSFIYSADKCDVLDDKEYGESPYLYQKVKQLERLYFYSQPTNESCKIKDLFIIHGDTVNAYATYNEFTFVEYTSTKGIVTSGWVKSEGLESDKIITRLGEPINKNDFIIRNNYYHIALDGFSGILFAPEWIQDLNRCVDLGVGINTPANKFSYDDLVIYTVLQHPMMPELGVNQINDCHSLETDKSNTIIAIKILTNQYQTARGIRIGSSKDDLFQAYAPKDLIKQSNNECFSDIYNATCYVIHHSNNIIRFVFNEQDKIRLIEMSMYPNMLPL